VSALAPAVVVLAAGQGRRMRSALPKVLHEVAGRSLLGHVLAACDGLSPAAVAVVVGHGREAVAAEVARCAPAAACVVQDQQRGTGDATRLALPALGRALGGDADPDTPVLVVTADTPLVTTQLLADLLGAHARARAAATVATAELDDPTGYGRVLRGADGTVAAVVEERDATPAQRQVREVNTGLLVLALGGLADALAGLGDANAAGEEYLPDVLAAYAAAGRRVAAWPVPDPAAVAGVNDRAQLAAAAAVLRDRLVAAAMRDGAGVVDPATTWLDVGVRLAADCVVLPHTRLLGTTSVGAGAVVGPDSTLRDTVVGQDAVVRVSWCEGAHIGPGSVVGPFTYLRPGTSLGMDTKAGAFVEVKNSTVGPGSKVPHLSYVGDAEIGAGTNLGAGTIVVNFDGVAKHRTRVGDEVRIGSDTMLVAPLQVGDGAYTGAGSVITSDVPAGALALGRARQHTVEGWVLRARPDSPAAAAARAAGADPDPRPAVQPPLEAPAQDEEPRR